MSDIYQARSSLKVFLVLMGAFILLVTLIYSNYLAENLKASEEKNAQLYQEALDYLLNNEFYNTDVSFQEMVKNEFALPIIIKNENGGLIGANFSAQKNEDSLFLEKKVEEFLAEGKKPLESLVGGYTNEVYVFNSQLLEYIRYFPIVQLLLLASFIGLGYYLINASKKAEQNRVWVGMAKETAHQLGTPISALIAWVEHLKENVEPDSDNNMVVQELENDVKRLELVADRFSKIGSLPELVVEDIGKEILGAADYMKKRASRHVQFDFTQIDANVFHAPINSHLFNWVIENLIRNSLDSLDGQGTISGKIGEDGNFLHIEISDSGKGIPGSKFKTVFKPGYSTKKRGWGLGLSLSKRIIEEYHKGKIYVKQSIPNEETTFVIKIPVQVS